MNHNLDQALVRDFPLVFRDRHASVMQTCMSWGFECGDGWEPLIRKACEKLEPLIDAYVRSANSRDNNFPCASQIKEKYGTLRFYLSSGTDEMHEIANQAENESEVTCETCGEPGKMRGRGWYYTACNKHTREGDQDAAEEE